MINVLIQILNQLHVLRDDFLLQTSGVVAIKDEDVVGIDGIIPFPSGWQNTTLQSEIPDDSILDEDVLEPLDSVTLADVDGMPEEGYVTIINDESASTVYLIHSNTLTVISPPQTNGKVGSDFLYEIVANMDATFSAANLPAGLVLSGDQITGVPTTTGTVTTVITAFAGAQKATFNLLINTVAAGTPTITSSLIANGTTNAVFSYTIAFDGIPNVVVVTGLPDGLTNFGQIIAGTPRQSGVFNLQMTISDEFGDSDTKTLVLTVS